MTTMERNAQHAQHARKRHGTARHLSLSMRGTCIRCGVTTPTMERDKWQTFTGYVTFRCPKCAQWLTRRMDAGLQRNALPKPYTRADYTRDLRALFDGSGNGSPERVIWDNGTETRVSDGGPFGYERVPMARNVGDVIER